jgi:hypothetical protein
MDDAILKAIRRLPTAQLMSIVAGDTPNSTRRIAAQDELAARASRSTRRIAFAALIVSVLSLVVSVLAYYFPRSHAPAQPSSAVTTSQR